jgi:hypothetical protein
VVPELNSTPPPKRSWNPPVWAGFLLTIAAFLSYVLFFYRYPVTRDIPWVNWLLFSAGMALLIVGLRRAFGKPQLYRGKIFGPILTTLSLLVLGLFAATIFYFSKQLPQSAAAPRVGSQAPGFTLADTQGNSVTLASLLSSPIDPGNPASPKPKGVVLIFYRGYW